MTVERTTETDTPSGSSVSAGGAALHTFAEWAAGLEYVDLPEHVISRLKQALRDGIGCAVFGSTLPWARTVASVMASQGGSDGPATIWGTGAKADLLAAALANGTALQSYELDDLHAEASLHGSSTIVPATLALAEWRGGVSGQDLLVAMAVGWEAGVRVNRCIGNILADGWHQPTIMGTIAATAAAGRLLELGSEEMYECLSLGILQASGLTSVQYGGMAKRLYAGRAAESGVQAALLAQQGFTAPRDAFGHPIGGFLTSFAPDRQYDVDALTRDLGESFAATGISFKLYSCCGACQSAVGLLADIMSEHPEVTADSVQSVEVDMTEHGYKHVGFPYVPDNVVTAQFSVEYCLAAYLLERSLFVEQFRDELLDDPRIMDLVSRVTTSIDPTMENRKDLRTKRMSRIRLTLTDGTVIEQQGMLVRGHADKPASEQELGDKFARLVRGTLSPARAARLSELTQRLETLADAGELVRGGSFDTLRGLT